jgi:excisionase family DNA binding protein
MEEEFLTADELSKWLKVTRRTIDRWRKKGLPYYKVGSSIRFKKEEILQWIEQNKNK